MPEKFITSPQNEYVKELVELRKDGETRRVRKRFFLEGRRAVETALSTATVTIHELIYCEHLFNDPACGAVLERANEKGVTLVRVSKDVFRKMADVMTPQGLAAVVALPEWSVETLFARPQPLVIVACGIQDPGNLGTLIRSCEAAGVAGLIALEGTADMFNGKVVRSTAAALLTLPVVRLKADAFLKLAAKNSLLLVATASVGGTPFKKFDWSKRPLALCIGSEGAGLPDAIAAACTEQVSIPMRGSAESLNAAVAASILLFEALA